MRILHITDAFGGGVESAMASYIDATPDLEHFVAGRTRLGEETGALRGTACEILSIEGSDRHLPVEAHRAQRDVNPDWLHLHSSRAGLIVRPTLARGNVVFSPHTFGFLRRDISWVTASALKAYERALAGIRIDILCAASKHEMQVASEVGYDRRHLVPHRIPSSILAGCTHNPTETRRVTMVGRIDDAKDPALFGRIAEASVTAGIDAEFMWIGDGQPRFRRRLEDAGVYVTGWLPRSRVFEELSRSWGHLHTASWEVGVPLAVLEADALGVPTIMRAIPQIAGESIATFNSISSALRWVKRLDGRSISPTLSADRCTQARALQQLYS